MAKILVGRDNPKEVNIGVTISSVAQSETGNAEATEELAQEPVEAGQMVAAQEGDAPSEAKEQTAVARRGKKRSKA